MSTESTEALIERVLAEHVCVGGTYWDDERKTTFATCQCGARCYLVRTEPSHAAHVAAAITQALAEVDEIAACGRRHPGDCAWIGRGSPMPPICLQPESPRRASADTTWAEDAAASHRALYDTDSGRLDNRSER